MKPSMHIIIVGPYPISPDCIRGGVEASVYGLSQELTKTQLVDVIDIPRMGGEDGEEKEGKLTIHRYINSGKHNQDANKRISTIVGDIMAAQPDVVHIHGTGAFSAKLYRALRSLGIKVVVTVHGLIAVEKRNALKKHISLKGVYQYIMQALTERWLLNQCKSVIVDTEYVADAIRHYGLRQTPIMHVVPQGIDVHYYNLHYDEHSKNILSVGSISKRKGHLLLVEAFEKACQNGSDATLSIYGAASDRAYCKTLQQRICQSPYQNCIQLVLNAPQEELDKAYTHAHIFALHTEEESQGIVFAEAMAAGLPVVSTKVGGVPYVVKDNECGLLCKYGDTDVFAQNLCALMNDVDLWQQMSARVKKESKRYNWTTIAEKVMKVYAE